VAKVAIATGLAINRIELLFDVGHGGFAVEVESRISVPDLGRDFRGPVQSYPCSRFGHQAPLWFVRHHLLV
jgi:hypothetical protein